MEALMRWVCSFVAYKVKVQLHNTTATCGDNVQLCSIELTDPSSTFEDYYENKISVLYRDGNAEAVGDCVVEIEEVNSRKLDIYCKARRAGSAKVRLDLGKWYYFAEQDINVDMSPSTADHLNDARFKTDGAIDKSFSADPTVMYRKKWSLLEANIVDRYENVVQELSNDHNICLELFNNKRKKMEMEYKDVEIQNGRLGVRVKINEVAKHNLLITLTSKSIPDEVFRLKKIQIQVNDTPFYLAGSSFRYPNTCVAGKEFQIEIRPVDVFGCPLPANSTTVHNLTLEILDSPLRMSRNKETIGSKIIKESNILIRYTVVLTKSGSRKLMIFDKDNEPKQLSFEVNADVNDVHSLWELTATPTETAYRRENLILTVRLLDRFNNEIRIDSSENIPDLLKQAGPDGLHCVGKLGQNNIGTIQYRFKQTGKYDLCLADRNGKRLDCTSFTIVVRDAPLDPRRSSITWLPQYDDIPDQPVFPEDESFQCRLTLKDVLGYNYDTKTPKECFEVRCGNAKVKNITVSSSVNEIGHYVIVVPLLNFVNVNRRTKFWCFVNGVKIENPLVLPTFAGFKQYNDKDCFVVNEVLNIACNYVQENDMIAHKIGIYVPAYHRKKLPLEEIKNKILTCRNILLNLLKAICYRKEAFKADKARLVWKDRASNRYKINEGDSAHFCSEVKEKFAKLMRRYHDVACEEFFEFFNAERGQSVIDLHGLLVGDETKLQDYKQQLYERGWGYAAVETNIKEQRDNGDEAIRKLEKRLKNYDMRKAREEGEPWLEIIVGAGNHSKDGQRIRPKVEDYLRRNLNPKFKFKPVNKGALVVTFETYSGTEPCFGEYYCNRCHHTWPSGRSWVGKWQACYKCHKDRNPLQKCYPLKQRKRRKSRSHNPNIVQRRHKPIIPHVIELCEKCIELGRMCPSSRY